MTGEELGYVLNQLFEIEGVLDAYFTAVQMKKNRPGILLTVLVEWAFEKTVSQWLLSNTSTFGVRYSTIERTILRREFHEIETDLGKVSFKYGYLEDKLIKVTPEYEDVRKIANETGDSFYKINQRMKSFADKLLRSEENYD